jgi:hypothetical protein
MIFNKALRLKSRPGLKPAARCGTDPAHCIPRPNRYMCGVLTKDIS